MIEKKYEKKYEKKFEWFGNRNVVSREWIQSCFRFLKKPDELAMVGWMESRSESYHEEPIAIVRGDDVIDNTRSRWWYDGDDRAIQQ